MTVTAAELLDYFARFHDLKAAERLQAGNVWINSLHIGYDEMPFGGVKFSGIGREHGPEALEYYLETKGVVVATP